MQRYLNTILFYTAFFLIIAGYKAEAQWTSSPYISKKLITDTRDPQDVQAVSDGTGGTFICWLDDKDGDGSDLLFQHVNLSGEVSFRADGKQLSRLRSEKKNAMLLPGGSKTAVVFWIENSEDKIDKLKAQRIKTNGMRFWRENGMIISGSDPVIEYSSAADDKGSVFAAFVELIDSSGLHYLKLQKITPNGYAEYRTGGITVNSGSGKRSDPKVIPDSKGGSVVFWKKQRGNKTVLTAMYMTKNGRQGWDFSGGKELFRSEKDFKYDALLLKNGDVYFYVIEQNSPSLVKQFILSPGGKKTTEKNADLGKLTAGDNSNVEAVISSGGKILLNWLNRFSGSSAIYCTGYDGSLKGKFKAAEIHRTDSNVTGLRFLPNFKDGMFAVWIENGSRILSRNISSSGTVLWDTTALETAVSPGGKKYLNSALDYSGGFITIFVEENGEGKVISGQRILENNSFVSYITEFNAAVNSGDIKISWRTANEVNIKGYQIDYYGDGSRRDAVWQKIGFVSADPIRNNYYHMYHTPDREGTLYYRIVQFDNMNNILQSEITRVTFYADTSSIIYVTQNEPNPFNDSTVITYNLTDTTDVKFEFFNYAFEPVEEIIKTGQTPGKNVLIFYADEHPTGVYFYRFTAGEFVDVKKMVIAE